jgi:hypothetical protein
MWNRRHRHLHHLPHRPARAAAATGPPRRLRRSPVHRPGARGGARPQVPEPSSGRPAPRRPGRERSGGERRSRAGRRRHLGTDERGSAPDPGVRPGGTDRSVRGPPARPPVTPGARAGRRCRAPDRPQPAPTPPRSTFPGAAGSQRPPGARGRRRCHHRCHAARGSHRASPIGSQLRGAVRSCGHARRYRTGPAFDPCPGARGGDRVPGRVAGSPICRTSSAGRRLTVGGEPANVSRSIPLTPRCGTRR